MMNKTQITLIITGFLMLALIATNPSIEDHREGVKKMYKEKLEKINKQEKGDLGTNIGTGIASLIGDGFIDKMVSRENFLLFSFTKVSLSDKSKNIGVGILGQVFVQDYEKIKNDFQEKSQNENISKNDMTETSGYNSISDLDAILKNPREFILYIKASENGYINGEELNAFGKLKTYHNFENGIEVKFRNVNDSDELFEIKFRNLAGFKNASMANILIKNEIIDNLNVNDYSGNLELIIPLKQPQSGYIYFNEFIGDLSVFLIDK